MEQGRGCMHADARRTPELHVSSWGPQKAVGSIANGVLGDCGRWAASDGELARRRGDTGGKGGMLDMGTGVVEEAPAWDGPGAAHSATGSYK